MSDEKSCENDYVIFKKTGGLDMNNDTNTLTYYGIKGQRWGVRRDSPSGTDSGSGKKASEMSDTELAAAVKRLRLEREYETLSKGSGNTSSGKKVISTFIKNEGQRVAKSVVSKYVDGLVKNAIQKKFG